jgi:adenosylhomocysteine nucleosidase
VKPLSPLLVCFAVEEEARPLRALAPLLGDVEILLTGVGATNSTRTLEAALGASPQFAAVLNAGFAGGLDPSLRAGALVCESSHTRLLWAARDAGCAPVPFAHSDRILITPAEKSALRAATEADAVDMESAALRAVCARRGIPFLNLRVISDAADEAMPLDFNRCTAADQQVRVSRVLLELVKSPGALPRLLEFHRTVRRCATTLTTALTATIASLRVISTRAG